MLKPGMFGRVACLLLVGGLAVEARCASSSLENPSIGAFVQTASAPDHKPTPQISEAGWRADQTIVVDISSRASRTIYEPGASFIKVHFRKLNLPRGAVLELSSPSGDERYQYSSSRKDPFTFNKAEGDNGVNRFSAMSISGDTVLIRLLGDAKGNGSEKHGVVIDHYMVGYPLKSGKSDSGKSDDSHYLMDAGVDKDGATIKTQCGLDDRVDAVCSESSAPAEYESSRAVARLLLNGSENCTAWRVGSGNHMITNYHCIANQAELAAAEIWFNYERTLCGGSSLEQEVKVTGAQLIAADQTLDYALFSVNSFSSITEFGHLGLEVGDGVLGDLIYIPQHGAGLAKQMAMASDMDPSGLCEISDTDHTGYAWSTDLGYFCDTVGGSSGSPVLLRNNNDVIALHHFGGCVNSGVKMSLIWPQISDHFGGVVPEGGSGGASQNVSPQASFAANCTDLACALDASASADPDGQVVSYSWDFGDGAVGQGVQTNHTFSSPGSYQVLLVVQDNDGAQNSDSQAVVVDLPNSNPAAAYSFICDDLLCDFNASLSSDSDGYIVNYQWDFGDGFTLQTPSAFVQHPFASEGQYSVRLTVRDNEGAQGQAQSIIEVFAPVINQDPTAIYSYSCTDLDCEFNAGASSDPDGTITNYSWNFGDGGSPESGGPVKNYTFSASGNYTVTLEVEDNLGAVASYSHSISVVEPVPASIELAVTAYRQRGSRRAILSWSGATGSLVSIFKDGQLFSNELNTGEFTDFDIPDKAVSITYQVCETDLSVCSGEVVAGF